MQDHHGILRREFERIAKITDEAYLDLTDADLDVPSKLTEASYKDWAGLLLRYHDAIERISKGEEGQPPPLPSMKEEEAAPDDLRQRERGAV